MHFTAWQGGVFFFGTCIQSITCHWFGLPFRLRIYFRETHILCVQRKRELAARLWSLALVPAGFAAFVVANGGVVVGDRANHSRAKTIG